MDLFKRMNSIKQESIKRTMIGMGCNNSFMDEYDTTFLDSNSYYNKNKMYNTIENRA